MFPLFFLLMTWLERIFHLVIQLLSNSQTFSILLYQVKKPSYFSSFLLIPSFSFSVSRLPLLSIFSPNYVHFFEGRESSKLKKKEKTTFLYFHSEQWILKKKNMFCAARHTKVAITHKQTQYIYPPANKMVKEVGKPMSVLLLLMIWLHRCFFCYMTLLKGISCCTLQKKWNLLFGLHLKRVM